MDDLPEDLAKPRDKWLFTDVMGIVVGGGLFVVLVGLVIWVVTHG